jgi:PGAP1-like protein
MGCLKTYTLTCDNKIIMVRNTGNCKGPVPYPAEKMDPAYAVGNFWENSPLSTVSVKTPNNVYEGRPLSKNYHPYSVDGILDKPIILVEGYDPANQISPSSYYQNGFKDIVFNGRDLFVVNLNSHEKSINENSVLLQQIIQEINGAKSGNHPTAVIGYSMGGIVARKALKNMELAGINHQTSLYVSFDSPHMGANAPLSLQETLDKIIAEIDSKAFGYTPSSLKRARNVYNSAAAREMLIAGSNYQTASFSSFPANLARVGVTSGSMAGVLQSPPIILNEQIANFRFYISESNLWTWSITTSFVSKLRGGAYYDNVPGGYLYQYDEALSELRAGANDFSLYQHSPDKAVAFVPTTSALAIAGAATTPARDTFKYYSPFDKFIAVDQSGQLACSVYAAQNSLGSNQRHDLFDSNQVAQLKCALEEYHRVGFVIPDRSFKAN